MTPWTEGFQGSPHSFFLLRESHVDSAAHAGCCRHCENLSVSSQRISGKGASGSQGWRGMGGGVGILVERAGKGDP